MKDMRELIDDIYRLYNKISELQLLLDNALKTKPVGKWLEEKDGGWYGGAGCVCSNCDYGLSYKAYLKPYEFDFCPNCGADMRGDKK